MISATEIASLSLARLGVSLTVNDIETENTTQAVVLRKMFQMAMDTVASKHGWGFLNRYQQLTLHVEDPAPMYSYGYSSPSDCIMVRSLAANGIFTPFEEQENEKNPFEELVLYTGNTILMTNVPDAWAKYTLRPNITLQVPEYFGRAVSAQLAIDAAPQLITNNYAKIASSLNNQATKDMSDAIANDMSRTPTPRRSESTFVKARW